MPVDAVDTRAPQVASGLISPAEAAQVSTEGAALLASWRLGTLREAARREAARRAAARSEIARLEKELSTGEYFGEILRRLGAGMGPEQAVPEASAEIPPKLAELLGEIWQSPRVLAHLAQLELLPEELANPVGKVGNREALKAQVAEQKLRRGAEQAMDTLLGARWREMNEAAVSSALARSALGLETPQGMLVMAVFRSLGKERSAAAS